MCIYMNMLILYKFSPQIKLYMAYLNNKLPILIDKKNYSIKSMLKVEKEKKKIHI